QYKKLQDRNKQVQIIIQTASSEQKQRSRASSVHSSTTNSSENFRRPTTSSLECSPSKFPSSVCSIASGPLVNHLLIKPSDIKRNQFKTNVSIKSPSTPPVQDRQQTHVLRPVVSEPVPQKKIQRSKEQEAEEAAELQQELDQLLTSLNLEKPTSVSLSNITEEQDKSPTNETVQLKTVAETLYNYEKCQVTKNEKKESPNLIDRLLTLRSVQMPKYSSFNPFPSRSFNENVAVNGYKLGLYAPDPSNR
ncbi:unnamed protein product, partial [Rotaria socialis]